MAGNEVSLKVKESLQSDVGRGIARLNSHTMEELGLESGDVIEAEGPEKKRAVALVWRARTEDEGKELVRLDGILRHNCGVSVDDVVKVRKADVKPAKEIQFAPTQEISFEEDFAAYFKERIMNMPLFVGNSIVLDVMGRALVFTVTSTSPKGIAVQVTPETKMRIATKPMKVAAGVGGIRYEDIGGLKEEIEEIREMVEIPMKHPEVFKRLGISPPKGVLLFGPPGCGKTLLAKAVATESEAHFIALNGPEIMSKWYGASEENLRKLFDEAKEHAPTIIFMDEIDAIAPKREEVTGEVERRVVSQLLTLMDGLEARGDVIVIAASNRPDSIDPALRRPGRFDREVEIHVPDKAGRKEVFLIHTRGMPFDVWYPEIAAQTVSNRFTTIKEGDKIGAKISEREAKLDEIRKNFAEKGKELKETSGRLVEAVKEQVAIGEKEEELKAQVMKLKREIESARQQGKVEYYISELTDRYDNLVGKRNEKRNLLKGLEAKVDELKIETDDAQTVVNELSAKTKDLEEATAKLKKNEKLLKENLTNVTEFFKKCDNLSTMLKITADALKEIKHLKELHGTRDPRLFFYEIGEKGLASELTESTIALLKQMYLADFLSEVDIGEIEKEIREKSTQALLDEMVDVTYGFTGADVAALSREAAMRALRRSLPDIKKAGEEGLSKEVLDKLVITKQDFLDAHKKVEPSAMREVQVEVPKTKWSDIGGLDEVKETLREAVEWPLKYADTFTRLGISPPKGILLVGPPGCGKTLLARAVATESNANFISIKGPAVISKWVGESEKAIREIFKRARQVAPSIIFFDEMDSIAGVRGGGEGGGAEVAQRVVDQMLVEMDGLEELHQVVVVGATNRPDLVDTGLLRPGRFDKVVYVPLPDKKGREQVLHVHLKRVPLAKDVVIEKILEKMDGFTGADIAALVKEAGLFAVRESKAAKEVAMRHFEKALSRVRPSLAKEEAGDWEKRKGRWQ